MSLAETQAGGIGKFFRKRTNAPDNPPEALTKNNLSDLASPDTEGVIRTGGLEASLSEPQGLKIRIIGSRDRRTGEILPCHQEIHNTYIELRPLEGGQEVAIE